MVARLLFLLPPSARIFTWTGNLATPIRPPPRRRPHFLCASFERPFFHSWKLWGPPAFFRRLSPSFSLSLRVSFIISTKVEYPNNNKEGGEIPTSSCIPTFIFLLSFPNVEKQQLWSLNEWDLWSVHFSLPFSVSPKVGKTMSAISKWMRPQSVHFLPPFSVSPKVRETRTSQILKVTRSKEFFYSLLFGLCSSSFLWLILSMTSSSA